MLTYADSKKQNLRFLRFLRSSASNIGFGLLPIKSESRDGASTAVFVSAIAPLSIKEEGGHPSTNARKASAYDFHPSPVIFPLHTAEINETCRNSSRAYTFER